MSTFWPLHSHAMPAWRDVPSYRFLGSTRQLLIWCVCLGVLSAQVTSNPKQNLPTCDLKLTFSPRYFVLVNSISRVQDSDLSNLVKSDGVIHDLDLGAFGVLTFQFAKITFAHQTSALFGPTSVSKVAGATKSQRASAFFLVGNIDES